MKKIIIFILITIFIFLGSTVNAEEYYTNRNGVSFTKVQYDFYTELMHEGYQEVVTQEMLDEITWDDLENIKIKKANLCPMPTTEKQVPSGNLRDDNSIIVTNAKSLEMAQSCTNFGICRIYASVEWFGEPNQQSYDVIGAYLDGPTRSSTPLILVATEDDYSTEEVIKYDTDGFGAVVPVLSGDDLTIDMTFQYTGTGTIFVSYQHAMSYISLANAQLFNIDFIGYGNVFDFYGAAVGIYDEMPGVYMDV